MRGTQQTRRQHINAYLLLRGVDSEGGQVAVHYKVRKLRHFLQWVGVRVGVRVCVSSGKQIPQQQGYNKQKQRCVHKLAHALAHNPTFVMHLATARFMLKWSTMWYVPVFCSTTRFQSVSIGPTRTCPSGWVCYACTSRVCACVHA